MICLTCEVFFRLLFGMSCRPQTRSNAGRLRLTPQRSPAPQWASQTELYSRFRRVQRSHSTSTLRTALGESSATSGSARRALAVTQLGAGACLMCAAITSSAVVRTSPLDSAPSPPFHVHASVAESRSRCLDIRLSSVEINKQLSQK